MDRKNKIETLRQLMKKENMDSYLITKLDPHSSETAPKYYNGVEYISGFTGSNGTVVVTEKEVGLWTDGRYFIQAENEIKNTEIILYKEDTKNYPDIYTYLKNETKENGVLGFAGDTLSINQVDKLKDKISIKNISLKIEKDLLNEIWENRPEISKNKVFEHELKYAGISRLEKLQLVRNIMKEENLEVNIISSLDDIAWLYNLRGNDVEFCTTFEAYSIVELDKAILFTDLEKLSNVKISLENDKIILKEYKEIFSYIKEIPKTKKIVFNKGVTNYLLGEKFNDYFVKNINVDITSDLKSRKNKIELENIRNANIVDCVALVKFIKWLKENVSKKEITEYSISDKLIEFRKQNENFLYPSFGTIAAYNESAAMLHYHANEKNSKVLKPEGFLLVDSGGQYLNGTTDITRTIVLGNLSDEMKIDFTLTLKSLIALSECIFLHGATGSGIDYVARKPMWDNFMDYKCGTGHGIGYVLNVHEGPQKIARPSNNAVLEEGMLISNEPGVYKKDKHGIRIENTIVVKTITENEFGKFMGFETVTPCPIDLDGIKIEMLKENEKIWLNNFHNYVYEKLSPYLNNEEKEFLKSETKLI